MAIYTIGDCLKLVEKRLDEAQKTISVRVMIPILSWRSHHFIEQLSLHVHGHVQGVKTKMAVNTIDTKVKEIDVQVKETGTLVKELHAHLVGTATASQSVG